MEVGSCVVRILGDTTMEVFRDGITPAEAMILRGIHGPDGVVRVHAYHQDKRSHAGEVERLKVKYGAAPVAAAFPGATPALPVKFKDAGITAERGRDPTAADASPAAAEDDLPADDEPGKED